MEPNSDIREEENSSNWSQLPVLVVWMVMDRLSFVDNMQLACCCKSWHYAFTNNPKKLHSAGDSVVWIVNIRLCKFFCISTKKNYVIHLPDLVNSYSSFLCSKDGWLLLKIENSDQPELATILLLNPFNKEEIHLPGSLSLTRYGGFSTLNGIPQLVALLTGNTMKIVRFRDKQWQDYTFNTRISTYNKHRCGLFFHGEEVYHFNGRANASVLNLSTSELRFFQPSYTHVRSAVFQLEGQVLVRIIRVEVFRFYKMNNACTDWVELDDNNEDDRRIADRSWFFGIHESFCAKKGGIRKVYWFNGHIGPNSNSGTCRDPRYVKVFNLVDGSVEWFCPNVDGIERWIDMG